MRRVPVFSPRRAAQLLALAATAAIAVACALAFGPQFLGGPAQYVIVSGNSMEGTLSDDDFVVMLRQDSYEIGDIVAYRVPEDEPGAGAMIIHRLVGGSATAGYRARGDNNVGEDPWRPREEHIAGKLVLHVPRLGALFAFFQTGLGLSLLAGLASAVWAAGSPPRRPRADDAPAEVPAAAPPPVATQPPALLDQPAPAVAGQSRPLTLLALLFPVVLLLLAYAARDASADG